MRFSVVLVLALSIARPAHSQQPSTFDLPIQEHVYPNGMRLLVLERPDDLRVAAKIFTDMGAFNEIPGELGAAHYLEHLMFKGTHTLGTTDWDAEAPLQERIEAVEADLIAELNRERNNLRRRGVLDDYSHAATAPRADTLRAEIARLDSAVARYRDHGAMMRWYQAFGGTRLTASTEQEYMKFDINLPRSRVALFFRVEADRMRNSVFREFDQERMILVEQRYGDLNRPSTPYYEQMNAAVGVVHPVFWPEGFPTDFQQYTRSFQRQLYERYFVSNNTTIVLVGGVSFDAMVPLVDKYFGWMERAPEPMRVQAIEPRPRAERRVIYRSADLGPRVEARFLIPGVGHPDRPLFDLLIPVVGAELESALAAGGVEARVNANTRVVHTSRFGVPSSLNFEIILQQEVDIEQAESILLATLTGLAVSPVDQELLDTVRGQLKADWHRTALNADALAFEIGHFQTMDSWRTLEPYLEARDAGTAADLVRLARDYFIPENRTIGIVKSPEQRSTGNTSGVGR